MSLAGKSLRCFKHALEELSPTEFAELVNLILEYKSIYGAKRPTQIRNLIVSLAHGASSPRTDGYHSLLNLLSDSDRTRLAAAEQLGLSKVDTNAIHVNAHREFRKFASWAIGPKNRIGLGSSLRSRFIGKWVLMATGGWGIGKALASQALVTAMVGGVLFTGIVTYRYLLPNVSTRSWVGRYSGNRPHRGPKSEDQPDYPSSPLDLPMIVADAGADNNDMSSDVAEEQSLIHVYPPEQERRALTPKPPSAGVRSVDSAGIRTIHPAGSAVPDMNSVLSASLYSGNAASPLVPKPSETPKNPAGVMTLDDESESTESVGVDETNGIGPPQVGVKRTESPGRVPAIPSQTMEVPESALLNGTDSAALKPKFTTAVQLKKELISAEDPHLPDDVKSRLRCGVVTGSYKICVGPNGRIGTVEVVSGISGADDQIMATVRRWIYKPQAGPVCFIQFFEYHIDTESEYCQNQTWQIPVPADMIKRLPQHATTQCEMAMQQHWNKSQFANRDTVGQVKLHIDLASYGNIHNIRVIKSLNPDIDKMIIEILKTNSNCRFTPAIAKDGKLASFLIDPYTVEFVREGARSRIKIVP